MPLRAISVAVIAAFLVACGQDLAPERGEFETGDTRDQRARSFGSLLGEGGLSFGGRDDSADEQQTGIGVNGFLWRAALDTISFMPVQSADPFGGVILTDWYSLPEAPDERLKLNVYILDRQLRADGVRVAAFRQMRDASGAWADSAVDPATETALEDTILTRAREIRVASVASN
ncbi:MAG: DUF3576 domain-containing protein [Inquilinaceae bacterium]